MAEFYDDYLDTYDSVPVPSPDRPAWPQSNHGTQHSQNGRSMGRKTSSRTNRAFVRGRNNYEEGYGSEEYDDGPLELTMIRVKVCSISFRF